VGEDLQQNSLAVATAFVNALKAALREALNTDSNRIRSRRLIRTLFTSHHNFVKSKHFFLLQINTNFLSIQDEIVHRDRDDQGLKNLAKTLRGSGLRSLQFAAVPLSMEELRAFVDVLAKSLSLGKDQYDLVNQLWNLDTPGVTYRAVDLYDTNTWSLDDESAPINQASFIRNFLYRAQQTFSAHLTAARIRHAKKTIGGNISGDSLSMESHFNIVFGKTATVDELEEHHANSNAGSVLVERLATSLKSGVQDFEDAEFREMLSKQISGSPKLAHDQDLLRRSLAVARTLEISEPPQLEPHEAAGFYMHLLKIGAVLDDLNFLSELFKLILSEETSLNIIQAIDLVSISFAAAPNLTTLFPVIKRSIANDGLLHTQNRLTEILQHLAPQPTLNTVGEIYSKIRDATTRLSFQPYLVSEGAKAIQYLAPIFASKNELILTEGFELLTLIGAPAQDLLEIFAQGTDPLLKRIATLALDQSTKPLNTILRDKHIENLESNLVDKRIQSLIWLESMGRNKETFSILDASIHSPGFLKKSPFEIERSLTALIELGGRDAAQTVHSLHEQNLSKGDSPRAKVLRALIEKTLAKLERLPQENGDETSP
jgi:hypothetical protein